MELDNRTGVSLHRNHRELRAYWHSLRTEIRGFEEFCKRCNPSRYQWLKGQSVTAGVTSLDFVVIVRWLMYCRGHYVDVSRSRAAEECDRRVSSYLDEVVKVCGNPADHWQQVSPDLKRANFGFVPMRRTLILPHWQVRFKE